MAWSKSISCLAAFAFLSSAAYGQDGSDDDVLSALEACVAIESSVERAQCLEAETAALLAARDRNAIIVIEREEVEALREETFGLRGEAASEIVDQRLAANPERAQDPEEDVAGDAVQTAAKPEADEPSRGFLGRLGNAVSAVTGTSSDRAEPIQAANEIRTGIVRVQERAYGKVRFFLENGQVWDQVQGTPLRVRSDGAVAHVRKAALGSYLLQIDGSGRSVRVRRVQ